MIVKTIYGNNIELDIDTISSEASAEILAIPAVIDPHVHFRTPGLEHKEDWQSGAKVALRGGCTTVFDMPNTLPPTITAALMHDKKAIIDRQLNQVGIPLRYQLFFGADKSHLQEISKAKSMSIGIKVFMGCSTGNLVIDDDESLDAVFAIAARENMLVAVHAEDEHLIRARQKTYQERDRQHEIDYAVHSQIRNIEVAARAVEKAIALCKKHGTKLYILHVSSAPEIDLIKAAKEQGLPVYAETTPHHLFFDVSAYATLGGKAVVNPPLREAKHRDMLFAAIRDRTIDTIGSDHAPHTLAEKSRPYGQCPSGMPGLEFMLPMLLNAYHNGLLQLTDILSLTSLRARDIFNIPENNDWALLDLKLTKTIAIADTHSKCGYTPYAGLTLTGWPIYTVLRGRVYDLNKL